MTSFSGNNVEDNRLQDAASNAAALFNRCWSQSRNPSRLFGRSRRNSSGGVIGAKSVGLPGGGPGGVRGDIGGVPGGVLGPLSATTFSGNSMGKAHADLSTTGPKDPRLTTTSGRPACIGESRAGKELRTSSSQKSSSYLGGWTWSTQRVNREIIARDVSDTDVSDTKGLIWLGFRKRLQWFKFKPESVGGWNDLSRHDNDQRLEIIISRLSVSK